MTREVPQLADATNAHTLVIESTHRYYRLICKPVEYKHRLCRPVGAPLWFSLTLPLNDLFAINQIVNVHKPEHSIFLVSF